MEESTNPETPVDPAWLAFGKLCRLPNLFTAWADIFAGYFIVSAFANGGVANMNAPVIFVCLLLASSLIYSAGMILNDYYDREVDAEQRPDRPIPSGAISASTAMIAGFSMLVVGTLVALLGGYVYVDYAAIPWRGGAVAACLSVSVVAYDAILKRTVLAPWLMGACRFFNILLGMSLSKELPFGDSWQLLGYDSGQLLFAGGIGLYIVGVTWFARTEAVVSSRAMLGLGAFLMLTGIAMLGIVPWFQPSIVDIDPSKSFGLWGILVLLSLALGRRVVIAVAYPEPRNVQLTIKQAILSLIFYDAAITLAVCGTIWSVAIVALLIPMMGLRRWMYST